MSWLRMIFLIITPYIFSFMKIVFRQFEVWVKIARKLIYHGLKL